METPRRYNRLLSFLALGGAVLGLAAGCSGQETTTETKSPPVYTASYSPNGTRTYTIPPTRGEVPSIEVTESCVPGAPGWMDVEYVVVVSHNSRGLQRVSAPHGVCDDFKLTPEDYPSEIPTPPATAAAPSPTASA